MDVRWRRWLLGGAAVALVGCNSVSNRNKFPDPPRQSIPVEEPVGKGPLKPETVMAFGNAQLDAADPKYPRSSVERERLLSDAKRNFEQVLEQQPKNSQALAGLGRIHFYLGDRDASVANYRKALDVEPRNARLWFELASVQSKLMRDYPAASESLSQAFSLEPDNTLYRRWLGRTLALSGRVEEGVSLLKQNQPEAEVRFEVAEMLHLIGKNELSRQQLQAALQADPNFALARDVLTEFGTPFSGREIQPARYEMPITGDYRPENPRGAMARPGDPVPLSGPSPNRNRD
jgi:tetratricopeptide (TPR) repeat protein